MSEEFAPKPTPNGVRRQLGLQPSRLATLLRAIGKTSAVLVVLSSPAIFFWASSRFGADGARSIPSGLAWMIAYILLAIIPCFMLIGMGGTLQANADIAGSLANLTELYESLVRLAKGVPSEEVTLAAETLRDRGLLNADEFTELIRRTKGIDGEPYEQT